MALFCEIIHFELVFAIMEEEYSGGIKMKLALLGTGMIVSEVLPVLRDIDGIELVAILSTPRSIEKAKSLAAEYIRLTKGKLQHGIE